MLPVQQVSKDLAGPPPNPAWFIGNVNFQNLSAAAGASGVELVAVYFDAGARTRPHIHQTDQVLWFTDGDGIVMFPGEPEQRVPMGGVVAIPAGRLHMHGAPDDAPVRQLAIWVPSETDWYPPVPDEWRRYQD
jgi:quercetin dioxygenase-like cupin family protein